MHRLGSRYSVTRFKLAAWILVLKWILIFLSAGIMIYSLVSNQMNLALLALALMAGSVVIGIIQWGISAHARCPLCLTPPIAHRKCARHRSAKQLFGSYRLHVACSVIFRNQFRCPYCGEWTAMQVRDDRLRR